MHDIVVWVMRTALVVAVVSWLITLLLRRFTPRDAAKNILETSRGLYSGRHEYRVVSPSEFAGLDIDYYDWMQQFLAGYGFRHVADIENVTLARKMPQARAFIRSMLSRDGTVTAGIYDVRFGGLMRLLQMLHMLPRDVRSLDLETELSDGTFITTSNSLGADRTSSPPQIRKLQYPRTTPPAELLDLHWQAVQESLAQRPGVAPIAFSTFEELLEAQHRQQELKNAHYASIGYMDRAELMGIADGKTSATTQAVADEIEAIKAERGETSGTDDERQGP